MLPKGGNYLLIEKELELKLASFQWLIQEVLQLQLSPYLQAKKKKKRNTRNFFFCLFFCNNVCEQKPHHPILLES